MSSGGRQPQKQHPQSGRGQQQPPPQQQQQAPPPGQQQQRQQHHRNQHPRAPMGARGPPPPQHQRAPMGGRGLVMTGGGGGGGQPQPVIMANNNKNHNSGPRPTSSNPHSGIPYGHVPGYLPGSSSLVEELDKRLLLVLRDGRHVLGVLRSFDQFSNMVLQHAVERKIHPHSKDQVTYFADMPMTGLYVVRGDTIVLLGQVGEEGQENNSMMKKIDMEEIEEMIKAEKASSSSSRPIAATTSDGAHASTLEWDFDKDLLA